MIALIDSAPEFKLGHDLPCQHLERESLAMRDAVRAGLGVENAYRA
jgi:hypothetical protein